MPVFLCAKGLDTLGVDIICHLPLSVLGHDDILPMKGIVLDAIKDPLPAAIVVQAGQHDFILLPSGLKPHDFAGKAIGDIPGAGAGVIKAQGGAVLKARQDNDIQMCIRDRA